MLVNLENIVGYIFLPLFHIFMGFSSSFKVYSFFFQFQMFVKNQFKTNIQYFQCNNGRKFHNHLLLTYLQSNGITIRFSGQYTSQ